MSHTQSHHQHACMCLSARRLQLQTDCRMQQPHDEHEGISDWPCSRTISPTPPSHCVCDHFTVAHNTWTRSYPLSELAAVCNQHLAGNRGINGERVYSSLPSYFSNTTKGSECEAIFYSLLPSQFSLLSQGHILAAAAAAAADVGINRSV